jgi:sugar lactone lactonase YvrE
MAHVTTLTTLAEGLTFPDTVRWLDDGTVWLTDSVDSTVLRIDPSGGRAVKARVPGRPAGIGLLPDGTPLVVSSRDRTLHRLTPSGLELHAELAPLLSHDAHQLLVDPTGRAYVGSVGFDIERGDPPASSVLVVVEPDGAARVVAYDLLFPNGMALAPDGRLLVVETFGNRITAFTRRDDGSLAEPRVWADLRPDIPAGLACGPDGTAWVTDPVNQAVLVVEEDRGVVERIATEGRHCFSCDLAGPERDRLLVTSAATADPDEARRTRDGRIEELPATGARGDR